MSWTRYFTIPFFLISLQAHAFYELDGEFSYDKKVYGSSRENKNTSRSYYTSFASYFWTLTALEFNYSISKEINTNNDDYAITGYSITQTSNQSVIESKSYGVGLRQAFAPKDSFLVPTLSLGYAKQFVTYYSSTTYQDTSSGATIVIESDKRKRREDLVFGTFALKIQLTKLLSLKGSVKTLFPADDFNQAKNYIKYTAGFSWMFQ